MDFRIAKETIEIKLREWRISGKKTAFDSQEMHLACGAALYLLPRQIDVQVRPSRIFVEFDSSNLLISK